MKFVSWLFSLLILAVALCFALNNRQSVTLNLWPAGIVVEAPLFLVSLGTLFTGVLAGALFGWFIHLPHRMEARRLRKDIGKLRGKIEDMNTALAVQKENDSAPAPKMKSGGFFRRIGS